MKGELPGWPGGAACTRPSSTSSTGGAFLLPDGNLMSWVHPPSEVLWWMSSGQPRITGQRRSPISLRKTPPESSCQDCIHSRSHMYSVRGRLRTREAEAMNVLRGLGKKHRLTCMSATCKCRAPPKLGTCWERCIVDKWTIGQ
eukprot:scaffold179938_cov39-Prasinocladus_malaysianus.AAC.1